MLCLYYLFSPYKRITCKNFVVKCYSSYFKLINNLFAYKRWIDYNYIVECCLYSKGEVRYSRGKAEPHPYYTNSRRIIPMLLRLREDRYAIICISLWALRPIWMLAFTWRRACAYGLPTVPGRSQENIHYSWSGQDSACVRSGVVQGGKERLWTRSDQTRSTRANRGGALSSDAPISRASLADWSLTLDIDACAKWEM